MPQTPLVQVRTAHSVSVPAQSLAVRQPTQAPLASQTPPGHEVPACTGGLLGTPLVQTPVVQSVEAGLSVLSICVMVPPFPSQTTTWQSPGVCDASGVLEATLVVPQTPLAQVRVTHSLPVGGQSVGAAHWATQAPLASQTPLVQVTPGVACCPVELPLQMPVKHSPWGRGRSVGSAIETICPSPSQTFCLQSCAVWADVAVPSGTKLYPQVPCWQTAVLHSSLAGQLAAELHWTQVPVPLQ